MLRYFESKKITELYAEYRIGYSDAVGETVMRYLKKKNNTTQEKFDLMVDVGCGSGQATKLLAPYFNEVLGLDVSPNQILEANKANQLENVTYCVGEAERLEVADKSVDLVISAEAAHWFDLPAFFKEVKRVLKPNGCLALICYHSARISPGEPRAGVANPHDPDLLANYIHAGIYDEKAYGHVFGGNREIFKAVPTQDKERDDSIKNHNDLNLDQTVGLLSSFDGVQNHLEAKLKEFENNNVSVTKELIDSVDLVQQFRSELRKTWNIADEQPDSDVKIHLDTSLFVIMACHLD